MKRHHFARVMFLGCLGVSSLWAVQMEPLSIERLAAESTLVLRGIVSSKSCQRDPEGRIYTKVELRVGEVWKGGLNTNRFTVVCGGGILGDRKATVSGQVQYQLGEDVVAFLVVNRRGEGVTLGLAQGKFHVENDERNGQPLVYNVFHGQPAAPGRAPDPSLSRSTQQRLTLAELERRVRGGNR